MAKTIFYRKVGRRYVPASEYDLELMDSVPKGNHVIMCYPGGQSMRYNIDPALAPMIAAGRYAEQAMLDAMHRIGEARPKRQVLTQDQRRAWQTMKKAFGDDMFSYSYASNRDIAEAGIKAMIAEAEKLMTHPAVKDQYEKFLVTCELARSELK